MEKQGNPHISAGMMQHCIGWCRKLGVDNLIFELDLRRPPTFDVSGLEAMTRLTKLHITVPFLDKPQDLGKLAQLQRLTLDYEPERRGDPGTTRLPFVYPEMDSVTKLSFNIGEEVGNSSTLIAWSL